MRPSDAPGVARALTAAVTPAASCASFRPPAVIAERLVARWHAQCTQSWVVDAPGFGPVGAAFAVVQPHAGWIAGLGVHPAYQGVGVGRSLMDASLTFLVDAGCDVVGLEASPANAHVLASYARRGLRPADITLRLRASAAPLAASGARADLQTKLLSDPSDASVDESLVAARAADVPLSDSAFIASCPGALVVCDPDAGLSTTALDIREGFLDFESHSIDAAIRSLGHLASARGFRDVELDLALASGAALPAFSRLGFEAITTSIRMARPFAAYREAVADRIELGRWSL